MYSFHRRDLDNGGSSRERDLEGLAEVLLTALKDIKSMGKELKYANWLKIIELKAQGLYDHKQLKEDLQHFDLDL